MYSSSYRAQRHGTCNDQVVGAILSGWRYDISGISPDLRKDYEAHLLLAATTLSFAAFLLAALVMHRLEALSHIGGVVHLHLHGEGAASFSRIPESVTISLEAVAIAGMFVSMLLWTLVTIATPVPSMVGTMLRERISPGLRERLRKQTA